MTVSLLRQPHQTLLLHRPSSLSLHPLPSPIPSSSATASTLPLSTSYGSGIGFYPTQYRITSHPLSFSHLNHCSIHSSPNQNHHLRPGFPPASTPITAATLHFSFSLHRLYFHHFQSPASFSPLRHFHYPATDSSTLLLLRSRRPTSGADRISGWLVGRHKLKAQNPSSVLQVSAMMLAATPLSASTMAVQIGGRIPWSAVLMVFDPTLSSPPWTSITLFFCCSQQRQVLL